MRSTGVKARYKVKSLYEASFLCFRGFNLIGKEPLVDEKGKWFLIFEETEELRNAVQEFYGKKNKERDLFNAFRLVKDFLYDKQ